MYTTLELIANGLIAVGWFVGAALNLLRWNAEVQKRGQPPQS
ncbi:MAG: hypothetical protein AB7G75_08795 [Candidatus Binatia bacterium]